MVDLLLLFLFLVSGATTGWFCVDILPDNFLEQIFLQEGFLNQWANKADLKSLLTGFGALVGLLTGFVFQQLRKRLISKTRTMPTDLLFGRSLGLILGLLIANLLLAPLLLLPLPREIIFTKPFLAVLSNIFFGILGYNLADIHGRTLLRLFNPNSTEALLIAEGILTPATAKILDSSVIIDGRINALLGCGLIEGQVIVSQSVLDELQQLADSSNNEKRSKGRRGLKLLTKLRDTYGKRLVLNTTRYEGDGTDERLLKLTADTGGTLITADYNLFQIAQVKELKVMNLSELVIALRPDVQPGETLNLKIVREGKEVSQGVAYLDDGTMVVIEGARNYIGQRREVIITGALQTPTGRMIFGRLEKDLPPNKPNKTKTP
ncbi:PIN/TRAM domain-containing protein [Prochlorococcus sp. MIT 1307]|uniref:PIN/TRAM domain-containing protein n=1 Tax=Prochlorococcus sp. MIT 1307 TaxID=3096219 RepID=UPI002A75B67D|nr:TRAM domain-containing protein [Prochlorococcus sp. MIT 1307]